TKLIKMFPDDETARAWIEKQVWPDGPHCPKCGSLNIQHPIKHKTMTHRCRDCPGKTKFSVKTGTVMQSSKLGYQTWAIAAYLVTTNLKGISSMKLHRDLEITQKSAWHLAHRLRKAFQNSPGAWFSGPVEADETYVGGSRKNMPRSKRKGLKGRGAVGKTAVAGIKDRASNKIAAKVVDDTTAETMQNFVCAHADTGATVYTDEASHYIGLPYAHESVRHSTGEYVRGMAHTNGMESFWSMLKRGHKGTFHKLSPKHLDRYVTEFAGRHNSRDSDTLDQMETLAKGMVGKRLRYVDLTADNGKSSGARG
ncbi:MAG: IS1595 family transposase, partial [Boseongicola sp. SB0664_bin_43]|nr:IS1595 family transposase [Boseongicola sp. SB0664_bin_43]